VGHAIAAAAARKDVVRRVISVTPDIGELVVNLTEYAKKPRLLADYLPWGFLRAHHPQQGWQFLRLASIGPDLESATEAELLVSRPASMC
jgi:hypothetical protein